MGRKKKNGARYTQKNQEAARAFREQRTPPEPYSPRTASPRTASPQSTPPRVPYNVYRRALDKEVHKPDELDPISAPDDHEDQEPSQHATKTRKIWADLGYYEHHPDNNAVNRSDAAAAEFKAMLQGHEKLGPVLKEYKILLNHSTKRTLLLQYPQRESGREYRASCGLKPLELRIKPKCGLVEIDIPMNIHQNFDKEKGILYGDALRNSRLLQQGGSYGLGGGLGVGPKPRQDDRRAPRPEGPPIEKLLEDFDDANNKGHVINKITLGGRIVPYKDGDPIYMTATFQGGKSRYCSRC